MAARFRPSKVKAESGAVRRDSTAVDGTSQPVPSTRRVWSGTKMFTKLHGGMQIKLSPVTCATLYFILTTVITLHKHKYSQHTLRIRRRGTSDVGDGGGGGGGGGGGDGGGGKGGGGDGGDGDLGIFTIDQDIHNRPRSFQRKSSVLALMIGASASAPSGPILL